jgi:RNA polymerase sigma-70 factor (ECF subfamily)
MVHLDSAKLDTLDKAALVALASDAPRDEERLFEWNWATTLISRAMAELSAEYSGPKSRLLAELRPFLIGGVRLPTYQAAAARLGVSVDTLRSHIFRLRSRYRELLRAEVLRTVAMEADVDAELRYLYRVLLARA